MRIGFTKSGTYFDPIKINDSPLEVVLSAKILGLTITDDLKYACPCSVSRQFNKVFIARLRDDKKKAMRIIFPWLSYKDALSAARLQSLDDRRQELTQKLFNDIVTNNDHKLHILLPPHNNNDLNLRHKRKFNVSLKTQRYKNDFISCNALKM